MKKSNIKLGHCFFAGLTFITPLVVVIAFILYIYDKFAVAISGIFVPLYKYLGIYEMLPRHVLALCAELLTVFTIVVTVIVVGWFVLFVLKKRRVNLFNNILENIPVVKTVFSPIKQAVDSLLGPAMQNGSGMVVRLTYPAAPYETIGIVTGDDGLHRYWVMIPFTMSPGTGLLLSVPKDKTNKVECNVSEALEFALSCGIVKLSAQKNDKEQFVSSTNQFWKAVKSGNANINIRIKGNDIENIFPKEEEKRMSFVIKVIYEKFEHNIKKRYKRTFILPIRNSVHRFCCSQVCYRNRLKKYSCSLLNDIADESYIIKLQRTD